MRDHLVSYNVDNYRPDQDRLRHEVRALLKSKPLVGFFIECAGNNLEPIDGYHRLVHKHDEKMSTNRNSARRNITTYVRDDAERGDLEWIDLDTTWPRTQGPGIHPPRSYPALPVNGLLAIGVHQQPKRTATTIAGQSEGIGALTREMKAKRDDVRGAVALGDFNRRKFEPGPGPASLAKRIRGKTLGMRIDCGVLGPGVDGKITYLARVAGVPLMSDHPHAVRVDLIW